MTGRSICDLQPVHIADMENAGDEFPLGREFATRFRHRTILSVPLIREGRALGAILVRRTEVRPFEEKHIAPLKAFADQAAIAIENVRLFKAEQKRTRELTELLQQQTATAEVLKVISRAAFDLQLVLDTLVELAARLCEAEVANIFRPKEGVYRLAASSLYKLKEYKKQYLDTIAIEPGRATIVGRSLLEGKAVHVHDVQTDPDYNPSWVTWLGPYRTVLAVPLLCQGVPIGAIALTQSSVRPFTEKQIKLVETFADQAVIAIENARLFEAEQQRTQELAESLEQQTATSEVLQVISSSPADLRAGVCSHAGESCTHLRRQVWKYLSLGRRQVAPSCDT